MDLFQDCRELERLAAYHKLRSDLRSSSRSGIVFGLLLVGLGLVPLTFSLLMTGGGRVVPSISWGSLGLAAVGLAMLVEGTWLAVRPSAGGVFLGFLTLLGLGLLNLALAALDLLTGRPPGKLALLFGALCLALAVMRFINFLTARALFARNYSEEDLARVDELLRHVTKTKLKDATDVITFAVGVRDWRVLLGPAAALFVDMLSKRVVAARKDEVTFEQTGPLLPTERFRATFCVRDQTWEGQITPAAFAKYLAWKLEEPAAPAPETKAPPEGASDAIKAGQHDFRA